MLKFTSINYATKVCLPLKQPGAKKNFQVNETKSKKVIREENFMPDNIDGLLLQSGKKTLKQERQFVLDSLQEAQSQQTQSK